MRSQTNDTTSLGCAIAAGRAEGINLTDLSPQNRVYSVKVHRDTYLPTSTDEDRKARNKKWKMAVERSYGWATTVKSTTMSSKSPESHHIPSQMLCKLWIVLHQLFIQFHSTSQFLTSPHFPLFSSIVSRWTLHNVVFDSIHVVHCKLLLSPGYVWDV